MGLETESLVLKDLAHSAWGRGQMNRDMADPAGVSCMLWLKADQLSKRWANVSHAGYTSVVLPP